MSNRNRTMFNSQLVYVGPTPSTGAHFSSGNLGLNLILSGAGGTLVASGNLINQLQRVQSCNYSFGAAHRDINQFGELAAIDRVILDSPTASLSISYLLSNLTNESFLGFTVDGSASCISGLLDGTEDEKNYFLKIVDEDLDAIGDGTNNSTVTTVGFGNGFLNSYSVQGSVGNFPSVDIGIEALNGAVTLGTTGFLPSINPIDGTRPNNYLFGLPTGVSSPGTGLLAISVLRPGDITFTLGKRLTASTTGAYDAFGTDILDAKIQSFNIGISFSRQALEKLGAKYAYAREMNFPIQATASIDAIVGNLTTGSLANFVNVDDSYDISVNINAPSTDPLTPKICAARYTLKNCKLNNQSFSSSIGSNKTVRLDFASQVGSPRQSNLGLFMSGDSRSWAPQAV